MKKYLLILFLLTGINLLISAQAVISGLVTDENNEAVIGANVFIQGSYDGTSTDVNGRFEFQTSERDTQYLIVSYISYQTTEHLLILDGLSKAVNIQMKANASELETVVISAGAFEASDEKKSVVMTALDIVTTASATGDIVGALQTLPGAQRVGEDGRLFVRGGAAYETRTFIDGLYVAQPYTASVPNIASRGKFSPFMFKGITFSSGGYSAEYGQALSSALILETQDLPTESLTAISLMTVGVSASHTKKWENTSFSLTADYTNLTPYFKLIEQKTEWNQAPKSTGGQFNIRHKTKNDGMIKVQGQYHSSVLRLQAPDPNNVNNLINVQLDNDYAFANASYSGMLGENWIINGGVALTNHKNLITTSVDITENQQSYLGKLRLSRSIGNNHLLKIGAEYWHESFEEKFQFENQLYKDDFFENYGAAFVEMDWSLGQKWAIRTGLRFENSQYLKQNTLSPRLSFAYKTGKYSQINAAAGRFLQSPESRWQFQTKDLNMEEARHYILNWQRLKKGRVIRAEVFYKDYINLVTTSETEGIRNDGFGYARGFDLFIKDKVSIKNTDVWISYSYLDTERRFDYYPVAVQPEFAAKHNFSAVYKYWIPRWQMLVGATAAYSSGRPFDNPNVQGYNTEKTTPYRDLSVNMSYLTQIGGNFTVLYCSATNLLGFDNTFGKQYSQTADSTGGFTGLDIKPQAKRFFFVGLFVSIGQKLEDNLGG